MKITKRQLKRIIREEKVKLNEGYLPRDQSFRTHVLKLVDEIIYELDDERLGDRSLIDSVKRLRKELHDNLPGRYPSVSIDDPVWD